MFPRILCLAAACALAASLVAPTGDASAKDDPAKIRKDAQEAIRKEFKAAGKHLTVDLTYFVDEKKLADSRWVFKDDLPPMTDPNQGLMMAASLSPNPNDASKSVKVEITKCLQKGGGKEYSHEFKAAGMNVKMAELEKLCAGYYAEFMATCIDPNPKLSKPATKREVGPAKFWATAVGTDRESKLRVRKDWYVWAVPDKGGTFTWVAESTMSDTLFMGADGKPITKFADMVDDLIGNLTVLDDKRLK